MGEPRNVSSPCALFVIVILPCKLSKENLQANQKYYNREIDSMLLLKPSTEAQWACKLMCTARKVL